MMSSALPPLLVFGEALTDLVRTGTDTWRSVAGGACWNVARVAATLGVHTGWAGAVSDDLFGREITDKSGQAGLDTRFMQVVAHPPLLAVVHQVHPPRYFFIGNDSADLAFDAALLPQGWQEACRLAHFGCISLVRQPLGARLVEIAQSLHARGVGISFDPNCRNLMGDDYPPLFERMARLSGVIKISDEDLQHIYPRLDTEAALARVRTVAPAAAVIFTQGAQGMRYLAADGTGQSQTSFQVEVVDTVGAGDACIGGFLASGLLRPQAAIADHLRFASATAALACTRAGAYAPDRAQVDALMARAQG